MDWQQKLEALSCLCEPSLKMRKPDDWYFSASLEIGGDGMLASCYGNGGSPEEAVNDTWEQAVTHLPSDRYLVGRKYGEYTRHRWNGYMWENADSMHKAMIKSKQ